MALELTGTHTRFTIDHGSARIETLDGASITIDARDLAAFARWFVAHEPDEIDRFGAMIATLVREPIAPAAPRNPPLTRSINSV